MMFKTLLPLLVLAGAAAPQIHAQSARLRGPDQIEEILTERMTGTAHPFTFIRYMGAMDFRSANLVRSLLGVHLISSGPISATPNSVNMLLWQMVLSGLADQLQANCDASGGMFLQPKFQAALAKICAWPEPAAQSKATMLEFWQALMSYDAPPEEFESWRNFFLASDYANRPAHEAVAAMALAVMYNPYFLLEQ
jgi:hypothetical protein